MGPKRSLACLCASEYGMLGTVPARIHYYHRISQRPSVHHLPREATAAHGRFDSVDVPYRTRSELSLCLRPNNNNTTVGGHRFAAPLYDRFPTAVSARIPTTDSSLRPERWFVDRRYNVRFPIHIPGSGSLRDA